jgi:hypothetical protein
LADPQNGFDFSLPDAPHGRLRIYFTPNVAHRPSLRRGKTCIRPDAASPSSSPLFVQTVTLFHQPIRRAPHPFANLQTAVTQNHSAALACPRAELSGRHPDQHSLRPVFNL